MALMKDPDTGEVYDTETETVYPSVEAAKAARANPAEGKRNPGNPYVESLLQGATLGFSDELQAGAQSIYDYGRGLVAGEDPKFGDLYSQNLGVLQENYNQFSDENPIASTTGEVVGGVGTGLLGAARSGAVNAVRNMPSFLRFGGAGAVTGGVAGAGFSEPGSRIEGAGRGAVAGGVGGAVLPPAAQLVKYPFSRMWQSMRGPSTMAQRKVTQALSRDQMTPSMIQGRLRALGPEGMIADAGGENLMGLSRATTAVPGPAKNKAFQSMTRRQLGRNNRVMESVKKTMGDPDEFYAAIDDIEAERSRVAAPLYKRAFSVSIPASEEMQNIMMRPAMRQAWKNARKIAENEGEDLPELFVRDEQGQIIGAAKVPSMKALHYMKRGLDDVISRHTDDFGRIKTDEGRAINRLKKDFLAVLDKRNPAYAKARQAYAGPSANMDALKLGRNFLRDDAELTAKQLARLSDSEKEFFRMGAARAIRDKLLSAPDGSDAYKRIFGNELMRGKLKEVFPNTGAFNQFAREMKKEATFHRTRSQVLGGSPTARIEAEKADMGVDPGVVEDVVQGRPVSALMSGIRSIFSDATAPPEQVREELAKILFSRNVKGNQAALEELSKAMPKLTEQQRQAVIDAMMMGVSEQAGFMAAPN